MQRWLSLFLVIICCNLALASDFLPVWQAFKVTLVADGKTAVWVKFNIAPEYHIYQNKIKIHSLPTSSLQLAEPLWPEPRLIKSPDLGSFKVYENQTSIMLPVRQFGNGQLQLQINYQGCKGLDLCFPEQQARLQLDLNKPGQPAEIIPAATINQAADSSATRQVSIAASSSLKQLLNSRDSSQQLAGFFANNLLLVSSGFFILGLLIAFTPCVFPLLPILLALVGGANISTSRSFSLALSYILGGAALYALAGVAAASLGYSLAGVLQSSWLTILMSLLFVAFALALFGAFNLQLPAGWQNRLNQSLNRRKNGSLANAFIIGGIANLVLSPCVTAPLAGALLYISTSGDQLIGAAALFALGLGSGLPLLLIAVFGKRVLPQNGAWMLVVKQLLAMLMLAMAIYMLSKLIADQATKYLILLWACGLLSLLLFQLKLTLPWRYGLSLFASALLLMGSWGWLNATLATNSAVNNFILVHNQQQLEQALAKAASRKQPVLLDYYAKWCVACKEMDIRTFANPLISSLLQPFTLIRVDVTLNNQDSRELQQRYAVMAPPSLVFLSAQGQVLDKLMVTGFIDSQHLSQNLNKILEQQKACVTSRC